MPRILIDRRPLDVHIQAVETVIDDVGCEPRRELGTLRFSEQDEVSRLERLVARRKSENHGGGRGGVGLAAAVPEAPEPDAELLAFDEALGRLDTVDPVKSELVTLLYCRVDSRDEDRPCRQPSSQGQMMRSTARPPLHGHLSRTSQFGLTKKVASRG